MDFLTKHLGLNLTGIHSSAKVIEAALKVLYKLWKRILGIAVNPWPKLPFKDSHQAFRQQVMLQLDCLQQKYPANSIFTGYFIELQTLALQFALVVDGESFEQSELQLNATSLILLKYSHMSAKEKERVVVAKSLASIFHLMKRTGSSFFF